MKTLVRLWVIHLLAFYLSITISISQYILSLLPNIKNFPSFVSILESLLSIYFKFIGLSSRTIDIKNETKMHFWIPTHPSLKKPNLVLIHGYGGNSMWQFFRQVDFLSKRFNIYVPDLVFFGDSYSTLPDRSDEFQARCVGDSLVKLGVKRYSMYAISYGGFVGYKMAEIYEEMVEKVVICSSGMGCTEEQKIEQLKKLGRNPVDLLLPENVGDFRQLLNLSMHKHDPFKWVPDCLVKLFVKAMCKDHRKEKQELVETLLAKRADLDLYVLKQETLLIWGDNDKVFPLFLAYQLQRHLGPKSKVEIIKDTGHAANMESPHSVNELIISFVLGSSV